MLMNRILVTGGAGFIGSNLIDSLIQNPDNEVFCLDNLYSSDGSNVTHHLENERFNFVEHDVRLPIPNLGHVHQIYNLACPASPPQYQRDPLFTLNTNVNGIVNVLEYAHKYNSTVLHASTSEIYGDPVVHPQPENYFGNVNIAGPRSCYDEGKRIAETFAKEYMTKYNLDVRVVRIFNTYGPNMHHDDGRVISNFITQALSGQKITIYGDGSQTRSFCYIDDMIEAFSRIMALPKYDAYLPMNLGNPIEVTIKQIAALISELTDTALSCEYLDLPKNDPLKRKPDIALAKCYLNWEPQVSLKAGILSTIDYFKKNSVQTMQAA
jgi:UDP-glucuronate decarboxylase